jgi:hypothetical protein
MLVLRSLTGRVVHPDPEPDAAAGVLLRSATVYSVEFNICCPLGVPLPIKPISTDSDEWL